MPSLCKSHQSTDTRQPLFERVGTSQSQIHTGYRKAISIGSRVAGLLGPEYSWHTRDPQNYDIQAWQIRDDSSNHLDTWTHSLHPSIGSESDSHGSTMFIHVLPISTLLPSPSQLLCPLLLSSTHQTDKLLSHWHLTEISVAHISLEPMSRNLSPTLHTLHQSLHSWTALMFNPEPWKTKRRIGLSLKKQFTPHNEDNIQQQSPTGIEASFQQVLINDATWSQHDAPMFIH